MTSFNIHLKQFFFTFWNGPYIFLDLNVRLLTLNNFLFKRNNPKYDDRKEITFEKIPFVAKHWETQ